MNAERWPELKALFNGALEQPRDERHAWLDRATQDPEIRREVAALLHAHDTAGTFLDQPPLLPLPDRIGHYHVERELGRGGMGVVYLALDTRLNRRVALKAVPPVAAADDVLRERLRKEARAAASLAHPGIATIYALEELDGELFLVSEYVGERTLRELLGAGPLPVDRAIRIAGQIARALAAAHAAGVVHRDLKPENIVLTDGNRGSGQDLDAEGGRDGSGDVVKLVDFGIALVTFGGDAQTRGRLAATPAYAAPEQLAGLGADPRSDLYALGVILGEMLTGTHPLSGSPTTLPPGLREILSRSLASEPQRRYQSALEFLADLEQPSARRASGRPYHWWVFHQLAAVAVYGAMTVPMWSARQLIGGGTGRLVFLAALSAVVVSSTLRLHRWFASRWYLEDFRRVHLRSATPLLIADAVFSVTTVLAGVAVSGASDALAVVLVATGAAIAVSFLLIEPSTTRAAFRDRKVRSFR